MKLGEILSGCEYELAGEGSLDTVVSGIAYDSRKVGDDCLFVALRGEHVDGHDFIHDAIQRGAAVIISEERTGSPFREMGHGRTEARSPVFVRVGDSREALACISHNFYGRPSEENQVIGITGTNGKTTTTYLIKSILETWGKKVGLIGTIRYMVGDTAYPAPHTTPESLEFQGFLSEMTSAGCGYVVAEVSSHALSQKRVDYTRFVVVAFTNLTRDHLDFHGTMADYYKAKERLFTELLPSTGTAVINADDEWGQKLITHLEGRIKHRVPHGTPSLITYGMDREADITGRDMDDSPSGISLTLSYRDISFTVVSPLFGVPNAYNILAAASVGIALDIPEEVIREGIRKVTHIKGRLEKVDVGQEFLGIIDYAHTPDALERLLSMAKAFQKKSASQGRVITLFGCGGERDRGKRPLMGEIATRLSDYAIITSDNPRSEDPMEII
ncbi:MAG TPA: UDP-N-acetylmuramoyl-L-alanyl-D-glutamate--2,6-diaminopimelate ligase, partial [Thermodesulfovibrionales bacterium]|nr:UDP-N-acetylmuramoyl-L-alanyl-D-glutamate--2,6-diaminopimelate ligase [Thermodesulfovibrionales bacterium]